MIKNSRISATNTERVTCSLRNYFWQPSIWPYSPYSMTHMCQSELTVYAIDKLHYLHWSAWRIWVSIWYNELPLPVHFLLQQWSSSRFASQCPTWHFVDTDGLYPPDHRFRTYTHGKTSANKQQVIQTIEKRPTQHGVSDSKRVSCVAGAAHSWHYKIGNTI